MCLGITALGWVFFGWGVLVASLLAAGKLVEQWNPYVPFAIASLTVLAAVGVLASGHTVRKNADHGINEDGESIDDADALTGEIADKFGGAPGAIDETVNARK